MLINNGRRKRTGLTKLRGLALLLCRSVTAFTPIIKRTYPNNPTLHTALDTANTACALLVAEADAVLEFGD